MHAILIPAARLKASRLGASANTAEGLSATLTKSQNFVAAAALERAACLGVVGLPQNPCQYRFHLHVSKRPEHATQLTAAQGEEEFASQEGSGNCSRRHQLAPPSSAAQCGQGNAE